MHKKNTQRLSKLMSTAGILAVLFGGLVAQSVRAVSSNPTPVCVGALCTVTFESTGDYYLWNPPIGAKNISFDLMGAQGGRSGGLGGRVTGSLTSVPTALYVYVGGAGNQGSGSAGGFNGGGNAGSGRGDEGSGGGATDLRSTTAVNDRIAVAAGGGGSGGFSGGSGGSAGGLNGSAGTSGQGQGGSGATQSSGGNGGYPNGGSWGTSGDFGAGGIGGSSSVSGGGGGGGGYYGGGGGGADIDSCCSNAGGGGGGSSWGHSIQTSSLAHTAAYRSGAGLAILSYSMPPSVTSFTSTTVLTKANSISYNLVFNESVTGLTNTDFLTTGSTAVCSSISVSGSATTFVVTANGCEVGTLRLTLAANSVTGSLVGPAVDKVAADVAIERTAPTVTVTSPSSPNAALNIQYAVNFSEAVTGLAVSDFTVTGTNCTVASVTSATSVNGSSAAYVVQVNNCADAATANLAMVENSVIDAAGNAGPTLAPTISSVLIDRTAPTGVWQAPIATSFVSPDFEIDFLENVSGLDSGDFLMIGNSTGCQISITELTPSLKFKISTTGCSDGTVQVLLNANSYSDALGNTGPAIVSASAVTTKIPQPAPSPTATPTATATSAPVASPTSSAAPLVSQPADSTPPSGGQVSEPEPETIEPIVNAPVAASPESKSLAQPLVRKSFTLAVKEEESPEAVVENYISEQPGSPQITVQNPTAPKPFKIIQFQWLNYVALGFGATAIVFAGIGVAKGLRQLRTRRIVRKFA